MISFFLGPGLDGVLLEKLLEIPEFAPCFELEPGQLKQDLEAVVVESMPEGDFWKLFPKLKLVVVLGRKLPAVLERDFQEKNIELRYISGSNRLEINLEILNTLRDFFNV